MLAISTISSVAFAVDESFYAGGNVGLRKPNINTPSDEDQKLSALGGKVLGYKFNKYLGVEGEYTDIGKVADKVSGTINGDATSIAAIGFLPLKDEFNLYGKLGVAATKNQGIIKPCANE